jgi:DNA-directed RNA polymerase specialized sigma24 family protein
MDQERDMMLNDEDIVQLYWDRHESAIGESSNRYGRYCYSISYNILHDAEDAEECVNDTWLRTWHTIPPQRPNKLSFFVGRITRNLSLDKYKAKKAKKRG